MKNRHQKRAAMAQANAADKDRLRRANAKIQKMLIQRQCGHCTACCTVLEVSELSKPAGVKCLHVGQDENLDHGCLIHHIRPDGCRKWNCAWRMGTGSLTDRPDISGIVLDVTRGNARFPALVAREAWPDTFEGPEGQGLLKRLVEDGNMVILIQGDKRRVIGPVNKLAEVRRLADEEKSKMELSLIEDEEIRWTQET